MDKRFLKAFLTPSFTVIEGYRLYPWCLKYRIWLSGIESPFTQEDAPITVPDLLLALRVCSEQGVGGLRLRERWLAYRLHADPARFKAACSLLLDYMDTAQRWPRFFERKKEGESSDAGVPWPLGVVTNLVKNGISYEAAMQMPEPKAVWLSTVFAIQAGAKLDILSTELEDLLESGAFDEPPKETTDEPVP
jgi:hypothetical protein